MRYRMILGPAETSDIATIRTSVGAPMSYAPETTSVIPSGYHTCRYCGPGIYHNGVCPRVKAIEYHPDGSTMRVEFHSQVTMAPQPEEHP